MNGRLVSAITLSFVAVIVVACCTSRAQEKQQVDLSEAQRKTIFLAAKDLFLNRGYGATSMADIAKAAGVDDKTLRSHFASKEALEDEMLTWWHKVELDNFKKWIADAQTVSDDPLEQTLAFLKNFENFAAWYADSAKQPPPGEIWAAFIYDHHNHSKAVRERIAKDMRSWEMLLEEQFATIFETHEPRIDVTAKDLAQSLMATIEGTVILGRSWDDRHLMTRRIRQFRQNVALIFDAKSQVAEETSIAALPKGTVQRIAFGSCAKHWQHQPIWKDVLDVRPDLFLFLGDAIYSDTDGKTAWAVSEKQLQGEWNRLADKPEYKRFRARVPIMATWDNHDYGTHNGGAEFELKEVSKRIFLDFFAEPQESERRNRAGIYDAKVFGDKGQRVQIILLDTRTFRGPFKLDELSKGERAKIGKVGKYVPHDDRSTSILGDAQWTWLEKQLREPAEVRLICSSTQIIPDQKGMDEWGCFPHERQRVFDLIRSTEANGVILLSGNVHFAEISKVETKAYPLLDFTSSGLTHINEAYAKAGNEYRVAGPFAKLNFGLVRIDWSSTPVQVTLEAVGQDGKIGFSHSVSLDDLQPKAE